MLDNLAQLHTAIVAGLKAKMPTIPTIAAYPNIKRRVTLPAVLVELDEIEPGTDPGTGETALIGRMQARCIIDPSLPDADILVRELAARVAVALQAETWGLPIGVASLVQIGEDGFKPELDGYIVWLVEWTHEFHLGEPSCPWADESGLVIMLGVYPEVGTGKEPAYWPVGDEPPENWGETQ